MLAARATLAQARAARRRHELKAPFSGTIIGAPDQVGATVGPGSTLFTLEQLDALVLRTSIPESARGALKVGAKVHVTSVSGPASTEDAVIRVILPSADPSTRRIPVEIEVPNAQGQFLAHSLVRATLLMGDAQPAQAVPATALNSTGGDHVFVLSADGAVHRVAVQVVSRESREVVVRAAVPLDRVVDYPAASLVEGTQVSVK